MLQNLFVIYNIHFHVDLKLYSIFLCCSSISNHFAEAWCMFDFPSASIGLLCTFDLMSTCNKGVTKMQLSRLTNCGDNVINSAM